MKKILLLFIVSANFACAQILPNTFKIGDYLEILPGDSLKMYYSCTGVVVNKSCADFYRVGKIDSLNGITGEFHDCYSNGRLFFKATMINGYLHGKGTFYYPGGTIKETGYYINSRRVGMWKYLFEDGSVHQVLNFTNDSILVVLQYDKKGKQTINNGNGYFTGGFKEDKECSEYPTKGVIKNGKPEGKWTINNSFFNQLLATEEYKNGTFIKGLDNLGRNYIDNPLLKLSGYYPNENTISYENDPGCPGDTFNILELNSESLTESFYPDLVRKIKSYGKLDDQWLIIGIDFGKKEIDKVSVYSSRNDTGLESYISNYVKGIQGWRPFKINYKNKSEPLYFSIVINKTFGDENIIIPAEYFLRNFNTGSPIVSPDKK